MKGLMSFTKKMDRVSLLEATRLFSGGDGLRFCAWLADCHRKNPVRVNRPWRETDDAIDAVAKAILGDGDKRGAAISAVATMRDGFEGTWIRGERAWYFTVYVKGSSDILDEGTCSDLQLAVLKVFWRQLDPRATVMTNDMGF